MGIGTITIKRASKGVGGYNYDPLTKITCNEYERKTQMHRHKLLSSKNAYHAQRSKGWAQRPMYLWQWS